MPEPRPTRRRRPAPVRSYALLAGDVRRHYLAYYKLVFDAGVLDLRTKELIAFGVSLATGAPNCVAGHLTKLRKLGVPEAEIEEAVAVALGVAGASVVDRADIAQATCESRATGSAARRDAARRDAARRDAPRPDAPRRRGRTGGR